MKEIVAQADPGDSRGAPLPEAVSEVAPPLLPEVGILALVPDEWDLLWMPRHQVLRRLARYFNLVWANPARHWRRRADEDRAAPVPDPVAGRRGFALYRPEPWLPLLYRPAWLARLTRRQRLKRARALLVRRGCTTILLYLWRPEFAEALELVPFTQSHYHIDDEYSFSEVEVPTSEQERRLIAAVDQIFVSSPPLLAKKGGINPHTVFVPNGVDFRSYGTPLPEPPDLAPIPRPRIGYSGVVKRQLDWPLVAGLAAARPHWSFVFVGPVRPDPTVRAAVAELSRRSNVHFLGFKPPPTLAAYPQHFDVCIMPYRANDYTKYIYPLKLHEYLAGGRPTVGTPIVTLQEFADVVTLASGLEGWLKGLETALTPAATSAERQAARQAVARRHDWDLLARGIARTMAERLGPRWLARFDEALDRRRLVGGDGASDWTTTAGSGRTGQ